MKWQNHHALKFQVDKIAGNKNSHNFLEVVLFGCLDVTHALSPGLWNLLVLIKIL